ncbi:MAG: DUF1844 domain-containing protein [Deltaproteobacteria bacterium]|nr:DUF1844 domain-containing protein [Deltaproteobacteria bacterium]
MTEPSSGGSPATIDFRTFILSLGTSAMLHLGEIPDPDGGTAVCNLGLARQTIDLLDLLRVKTVGNLDPEELRLLDTLLYDLHLRFAARAAAPPRD